MGNNDTNNVIETWENDLFIKKFYEIVKRLANYMQKDVHL